MARYSIRALASTCLLCTVLVTGCSSTGSATRTIPNGGTIEVTDATFAAEVLMADGLVMLDFWAEWCVPCHEIEPVLEKLAPEYANQVKICRINVDDNPELVTEYVPDNIFPCLILMQNGNLLDRQYGTDPKMEIEPFFRKWFDDALARN